MHQRYRVVAIFGADGETDTMTRIVIAECAEAAEAIVFEAIVDEYGGDLDCLTFATAPVQSPARVSAE